MVYSWAFYKYHDGKIGWEVRQGGVRDFEISSYQGHDSEGRERDWEARKWLRMIFRTTAKSLIEDMEAEDGTTYTYNGWESDACDSSDWIR